MKKVSFQNHKSKMTETCKNIARFHDQTEKEFRDKDEAGAVSSKEELFRTSESGEWPGRVPLFPIFKKELVIDGNTHMKQHTALLFSLLFLVGVAITTPMSNYGPLIPQLEQAFHLSTEVGWIGSSFFLGMIVSTVLSGLRVDRVAKLKEWLLAALLGMLFGTLLLAFSATFW